MLQSRALGLAASAAISLVVVASASAQPSLPPVSPEVRAAALEVMDYIKALPGSGADVVSRSDHYLNSSREDLQAAIVRGRAGVDKAASDLAAMQFPAPTPGFDMTFVLARARTETAASIEAARIGIDAIEKMSAAQDASDCPAHHRQEQILQKAKVGLSSSWGWWDRRQVQDFLGEFAGVERSLPPAPSPLPSAAQIAADDVRRNDLLADDLAFHVRCPLPAAGLSFEIELVLAATAGQRASNRPAIRVVSISDEAQRTPVELRFRSFKLREPERFNSWALLGKPLKFQWEDRHMKPAQ